MNLNRLIKRGPKSNKGKTLKHIGYCEKCKLPLSFFPTYNPYSHGNKCPDCAYYQPGSQESNISGTTSPTGLATCMSMNEYLNRTFQEDEHMAPEYIEGQQYPHILVTSITSEPSGRHDGTLITSGSGHIIGTNGIATKSQATFIIDGSRATDQIRNQLRGLPAIIDLNRYNVIEYLELHTIDDTYR